jgi:hypothetical protein
MSLFDYTLREQVDLRERFSAMAGDFPIRGQRAWQGLVGAVFALANSSAAENDHDPWDVALQDFLEAAPSEPGPPPRGRSCCVFVSHRRADAAYAERIAYLATKHGFMYWLDVHDPHLVAATGSSLPSPAYEVLIAALIEIALLNTTHIVSVHTKSSDGSRWMPYEMGRAKQRRVFSSRSCGWFDSSSDPASRPVVGEYMFLAAQAKSEAELNAWFAMQQANNNAQSACRLRLLHWTRQVPASLP